jgi:DNA-binding transcriptional regulator GbsR (MarR family)
MDRKATDRFIETWGAMGSLWGINTSMARVHALLMVSDKPVGLDDIADRLQISRGNASMCLKDLRAWGVARKVNKTGDRRDFYVSEDDVWKMFFRIASERKRREFDPAIESVREVLGEMKPKAGGGAVHERFAQMRDLLETMDAITSTFLADEDQARAAMTLLSGLAGRKD